ncbi:relaxase/mobilization nuclease domain-containing protein [Dellaglioa algida]|uniref:relaxase/mobilization nuclease domain-containing protein n=1 Tax=Dellaglioa algida TaxID=105612 RepID=UPI0024C49071|nr:relaxase/mobilization nuclease domain-containing protein [Dellaglioa algida]MDK1727323.1 relaxase/mobilization nuclease domain-containing protein [Dellaglioa algida]
MATIAKISNGANASSALNYALGENKAMHESTEKWLNKNQLEKSKILEQYRAVAIGGTNGIDPRIASDQFEVIRDLYNQTKEKNQVLRVTQSFALDELTPKNPSDWEKANELGVELAEKLYPQHQSAVYTHLDGKNHVLHNHIIVNKVNLETGKKLRETPGKTVEKARTVNDLLAIREGWHVLEKPNERFTDTEKELVQQEKYSYMADLRDRINHVLADSSVSSFKTFSARLEQEGVTVSERGSNVSYSFLDTENKQRRARGARLGQDFEKETIFNELENRSGQKELASVTSRESTTSQIEQQTQQREQRITSIMRGFERRESTINHWFTRFKRFTDAINQFNGKIQDFRIAINRRLETVKQSSTGISQVSGQSSSEEPKNAREQLIAKMLVNKNKNQEKTSSQLREKTKGFHR